MENLTIGTRIAELRKKVGLTQSQLADRLMISNKAVSKWESNNGAPCLEMLIKLSQILNCSLDYLILGKRNPKKTIIDIPLILGTDEDGDICEKDLRKLIHCLLCGESGSGKSILMHNIITQLISNYHHDDLKLALVDTKKVEFSIYNNVPHLYRAIATTPKEASALLSDLVTVLEARYELLAALSCQNIVEYNKTFPVTRLPLIVVVIDELADITSNKNYSSEKLLQRLTQLGRAAGIHVVAASYTTKKDILKGIVTNNFPTKIAFKMKKNEDYEKFLETKFDLPVCLNRKMLINPYNEDKITMVDCTYISTDEIKNKLIQKNITPGTYN